MEYNEFCEIIEKYLNELQIKLNEKQKDQFYKYMNMLIEWNEKINLTAIVEPKEVILKHFVDSLTISKYIEKNSYIADVGTGAGFPGIPLKILRDDIKVVLVDSLNKRIKFLDEIINKLELKNIKAIHSRAEEFGQNVEYREQFNIVTSRAVANLSTLSEYLMPLAKVGGKCLCMKGPEIEEEVNNGKIAIKILGGTITNIYKFNLPQSEIGRTIVEITKKDKTNKKYPRKAGLPSKEPL